MRTIKVTKGTSIKEMEHCRQILWEGAPDLVNLRGCKLKFRELLTSLFPAFVFIVLLYELDTF